MAKTSVEYARLHISHALDSAISANAFVETWINNEAKERTQAKLDIVRELLNELYWSLGDPEAMGQ